MIEVKVLILAILQGIAEFLPVSSSGHLDLASRALGVSAPGLLLNAVLHFGTLVAVVVFYRRTVISLVKGFFAEDGAEQRTSWTYFGFVLLSMIPSCLVYFLAREGLDAAGRSPQCIGGSLLFTGVVLLSTAFFPRGKGPLSWGVALLMGLAQALALFPGLSRSGMTLSFARALKVDSDKSAEFSFLMVIPIIFGGTLLEIVRGWGTLSETDVQPLHLLLGGAVAAVVGYFSLVLLVRTLRSSRLWLFGPYCILAGLLALFLV